MSVRPPGGEQPLREQPQTSGQELKAGLQHIKEGLRKGITQEAPRALERKCSSAMLAAKQAGLFAREVKGMVAPHATSMLGKLGEVASAVGQFCLDKIGLKDATERKLDHCQKRSEKLAKGLDAKLAPKEKELAAKEAEAEGIKALYRDALGLKQPVVGGLNAFEIKRALTRLGEQETAARDIREKANHNRAQKEIALRELRERNIPPSEQEIDEANQALDQAVEELVDANDKWRTVCENLKVFQNPEMLKQKEAQLEQLPQLTKEVKALREQKLNVLQAGADAQRALFGLKEARRELTSANRELRHAVRDRDLAQNRLAFAEKRGTEVGQAREELEQAEARIIQSRKSSPENVKKAKEKFDQDLASYEKAINEVSSWTGVSSAAPLAWPEQARVIAADVKTRPGDLIEEQKDKHALSEFNRYCDGEVEVLKKQLESLDQIVTDVQSRVALAYGSVQEHAGDDEVLEGAYAAFQKEPSLANYQALKAEAKRALGVDFFASAGSVAKVEEELDVAWRQKVGADRSKTQFEEVKTKAQQTFGNVQSARNSLRQVERNLGMTFEEAEIKGNIHPDLQLAKESFEIARRVFEQAIRR